MKTIIKKILKYYLIFHVSVSVFWLLTYYTTEYETIDIWEHRGVNFSKWILLGPIMFVSPKLCFDHNNTINNTETVEDYIDKGSESQ